MDKVDNLIQKLGSPDSYVRQNAASALCKIGEPAVESLIKALEDEYYDVRVSAANTLGLIGDIRAVEPLIKALGDESKYVQRHAAEALGKISKEKIAPLYPNLICKRCFHKFKLCSYCGSFGFGGIKYYVCRNCGNGEFIHPVKTVVALLDKTKMLEVYEIREPSQPWDDDAMIVLWDSYKGQWLQYYQTLGWPIIEKDKPLASALTDRACSAIQEEFGIPEGTYSSGELLTMSPYSLLIKGKNMQNYTHEKCTLYVNWFSIKKPFDFDEVNVLNATDFDMSEFIMKIRNDMDRERMRQYKNIRVVVKCELSQNSKNLLKNTFGEVKFE